MLLLSCDLLCQRCHCSSLNTCLLWPHWILKTFLKVIVHPLPPKKRNKTTCKFCHCLLFLISFQTRMTYFILWNIRGYLKNVGSQTVWWPLTSIVCTKNSRHFSKYIIVCSIEEFHNYIKLLSNQIHLAFKLLNYTCWSCILHFFIRLT